MGLLALAASAVLWAISIPWMAMRYLCWIVRRMKKKTKMSPGTIKDTSIHWPSASSRCLFGVRRLQLDNLHREPLVAHHSMGKGLDPSLRMASGAVQAHYFAEGKGCFWTSGTRPGRSLENGPNAE